MSEIITTTARTASTIAAEIRFLDRQAANTCIQYIIEIGRRLVEAKSLVGDGQWLEYIKTELHYEKSTAQNYMRLYERFGSGQKTLFGSFTETETFGSLTYTKALALLQVPDEELEEFAEDHDIENMSTRELKRAIRERDAAIQEKEAAIDSRDTNSREVAQLREQIEKQNGEIDHLIKNAAEVSGKLSTKDAEIEKLKGDLQSAKKRESEAKAALKKAKENPDIPAATMERLRSEAEAEAATKAASDVQKKLDAANREREMVQDELRRTQQKLDAAQKSIQLANPDVAVFNSIFEQVQSDFYRLHGALLKVQQSDPATAEKLLTATKALLDKLSREIGD